MDNINKILDGLGGIASIPGLGAGIGGVGGLNPLGAALGIGANDPLAAGVGILGGGMMSGGSSSDGNPAQALGQTPDYSYVDAGMMPIGDATGEFTGLSPSNASVSPLSGSDGFSGDVIMNLPGSDGPAQDKKEFNYQKMLEGIAAGSEYMSEASQDTQQSAGGTTTRGSLPAQPMTNLYGNMGGNSPAMQAIQNSKSMIGAQPSIEQILQSLAR